MQDLQQLLRREKTTQHERIAEVTVRKIFFGNAFREKKHVREKHNTPHQQQKTDPKPQQKNSSAQLNPDEELSFQRKCKKRIHLREATTTTTTLASGLSPTARGLWNVWVFAFCRRSHYKAQSAKTKHVAISFKKGNGSRNLSALPAISLRNTVCVGLSETQQACRTCLHNARLEGGQVFWIRCPGKCKHMLALKKRPEVDKHTGAHANKIIVSAPTQRTKHVPEFVLEGGNA